MRITASPFHQFPFTGISIFSQRWLSQSSVSSEVLSACSTNTGMIACPRGSFSQLYDAQHGELRKAPTEALYAPAPPATPSSCSTVQYTQRPTSWPGTTAGFASFRIVFNCFKLFKPLFVARHSLVGLTVFTYRRTFSCIYQPHTVATQYPAFRLRYASLLPTSIPSAYRLYALDQQHTPINIIEYRHK